ncbi:SPOR domain-containing protein [Clostridium algidicarnis]|uniref:Sporulation related protein n=2 Tax=Clostridium algidicarnis TaxID=37659 RepID=A0A2S6FWR8_9CLOT|nr:SPOR domain-containing protein [Clostridium algidicarnis]MBB6630606.1 SPOR domain-containing protein [Clostridium algidicarnis]MBU3194845.1 SPOR domain-containing protein [Clostridium algidicarnis]MBU3206825.1 SPOR domain-containing protein [Clostridium algidicarnis]MBU3219240.1 SPOR domain-containing protein [Clostridium algidicarnis]PPK47972.1 sporulation related protein [Clostridium algidicarnis DSM 15099]
MKYTRYNYKKKKPLNYFILFFICGVFLLSLAFGSVISKLLIKDKSSLKKDPNEVNIINENKKAENSKLSFYLVQTGVFSKVENATENKKKLSELGYESFIIEDEGKQRVIIGIFEEEEATNIVKDIKEKGIDIARILLDIDKSNNESNEIAEIISANIKVFSKLREKEVMSIKTEEIKKWTNELEPIKTKGSQNELLEEIKNFTLELPEEIKKEDLNKYYEYIYIFYKKLIQNK